MGGRLARATSEAGMKSNASLCVLFDTDEPIPFSAIESSVNRLGLLFLRTSSDLCTSTAPPFVGRAVFAHAGSALEDPPGLPPNVSFFFLAVSCPIQKSRSS